MNDELIEFEKINPCTGCKEYGKLCNGIDGGECEKANIFYDFVAMFKKLSNEIQVTRSYIHDMNLEWDLISYLTRKEKQNV